MTAAHPIVDLLVVGGGINGTGIARDAAGRGLSVLLLEQADLAAHTSSASTKLIHGGLRYLEHGKFRLVAEALAERERLLDIAPHLVHPLRFILPHAPGLRPRWQIRLGFFAYDHLGRRKRLAGSGYIPLSREPAGAPLKPGFVHGFTYSDCSVDDSRLVVLNALDAAARGAVVRTRTRLLEATPIAGLWHARYLDLATGTTQVIRARALVNASGAWVNSVREAISLRVSEPVRLVQGSHIVVPRLFDASHAYILQNPDGRIVFAIPYEQRFTLIGTTDVPFAGDPAHVGISSAEVSYLCESIRRYFRNPISESDTLWSYSGVRALYDDGTSEAAAVTRDYVLRMEGGDGDPPVLSVIGGKITTYRKLAETALARLLPMLAGHATAKAGTRAAAWTHSIPLPGGCLANGDFEQFVREATQRWRFLASSLVERLARAYGTRMELIIGKATSLEGLGQHFGAGLTEAEVEYLRRQEWAVTAEDILWRRSKLGLRVTPVELSHLERYLSSAGRDSSTGQDAQAEPPLSGAAPN